MNKKRKLITGILMTISLLVFSFKIDYTNTVFAELPPDMYISRQVVTNDNAIIFAECYNSGRDIVKIVVDLYKGKKQGKPIASIEKNVDTNVRDIQILVNIQKDMGLKLKQGEEYYLDINSITIYGTKPSYYGSSSLFITPNVDMAVAAQNIGEDNAIVKLKMNAKNNETILKAGLRVTCFGCIVGTMEKEINQQTDDLSIDFDLKNEGKFNLLPNCNYQYNAYVVTKSLSGWKNEGRADTYGTFKTLEGASITKGINQITKRNVLIRGKIFNPREKNIEKYGLIIKKRNKIIGQCEKLCSILERNITSKQLSFNIRRDMKKIRLVKGKKYQYEIYSFVGGKKYVTNGTFKVKKNNYKEISLKNSGISDEKLLMSELYLF